VLAPNERNERNERKSCEKVKYFALAGQLPLFTDEFGDGDGARSDAPITYELAASNSSYSAVYRRV
jgi:hypothetical protein